MKNHLVLLLPLLMSCLIINKVHSESGQTQFSYGGMIKFDALFSQHSDSQRTGNVGDDFVVPSTIATGDGSNEGDLVFDSNAKFSRFWFKTLTDTEQGKVKSYLEMDFNAGNDERLTNQSSNGLRHGYFSWQYSPDSSVLAGQTWSTFFNVSALPEAVDFIGPTSGSIFVRQSQLRYHRQLPSGQWFFAIENPAVSLGDAGYGMDNNQVDSSAMPDIIARYDGKFNQLYYSLAMMARQITFNDGANDDSQIGSAFTFSAVNNFSNGDNLKLMFSYGHLGRYIALNAYRDGVVDLDGDIELITAQGGFIAYRHFWTDKLRSTFMYGFSQADNPDQAITDLTKSVSNQNLNLMYSPVKKLTFGIEYIQAQRDLESGSDGELKRLQFTSKWVF